MSAQTALTGPAEVRPAQKRNPVTGPISQPLDRVAEGGGQLAGAAPSTVVTLVTALVAARADEDGSRYFQDLSERDPADATARL